MPGIVRGSKWEAAVAAGLTSLAVALGLYFTGVPLHGKLSDWNAWLSVAATFALVQTAVAYWLGLRNQRKLDNMQLALKQASAGNWEVRLPEDSRDIFAGVSGEFNAMLEHLEARLKLLQQLGEKDVMEEASAQEAAVLEERKRLARDLHDTVSQQLFALHMSASSLPKLLERNPGHAEQVMRQLIDMSSAAQRQMRGLIAQLRPMELQGRTLTEALERWFPDYCRQNGLQGTLEAQLDNDLSDAKEHQLFLIIQEAMANVVKHAEAQSVRLFLGETEHQIALTIEDNGNGFRGDQVRAGSYGMSTMRERAQKLGGEAEIVTKSGSGTRVKVWIPKFGHEAATDEAKQDRIITNDGSGSR